MNNIWDSMHRGLEKASQEAARIARVQHLRSTIHRQTQQMSEQEKELLNRTMQLFTSGTLAQPELLSLCQQLLQTHQQIVQAQNELQQITSQATASSPSTTSPTPSAPLPAPSPNAYQSQTPINQYAPTTQDGNQPGQAPPPPLYQTYTGSTIAVPPPPPPGGETLTISSHETLLIPLDAPAPSPPPPPASGDAMLTISSRETFLMPSGAAIPPPPPGVTAYTPTCPRCGTPALPGNLYCQQCGTALQGDQEEQKPTARAEHTPALGDQTVFATEDEPVSATDTPEVPITSQPAAASDETVRKPAPPTPENNGGN